MNEFRGYVCGGALFALLVPGTLSAQTTISTLLTLGINIFSYLIGLFLVLAVVVFFWGIVKFLTHAGTALSDEKSREEGKKVMVWGMVGIFVMVSLWAIVGFVQQSLLGGLGTPPPIPVPPATMPTP